VISVHVSGADALIAKLNRAQAALKSSEPSWMKEAGVIVETAIEANIAAQGLIDSGDLIGSGRVFGQTAHGITVGFGQGLDYAASIEMGSVEHPIPAKNVENLKFFWARENTMFYGPLVPRHPGNRPYRFMRNGSEESMPALITMFIGRLRSIFGGL
jgi:hypothetical protein